MNKLHFQKLGLIALLIFYINACMPRKVTPAESKPKFFEDWSEDDRIKFALKYTINNQIVDVRRVQHTTQIPMAVLYTFLSLERYNDWKNGNSMSAYREGDLLFSIFGGRRSLGPANIGLSAIEYIFLRRKTYFVNQTPKQVYEKILQSEYNSIYWGAIYLKVIYEDVLSHENYNGLTSAWIKQYNMTNSDLKWVKAMGLYNEGLGNVSSYRWGPYSERAAKMLREAWDTFPAN